MTLVMRGSSREHIVSVATGRHHSLALTKKGQVYSWGDNDFGQLGIGSNKDANRPILIKKLGSSVIDISSGANHSLAVTKDNQLYVWGANGFGQLGIKSVGEINPTLLSFFKNRKVIQAVTGLNHSIALLDNHEVYSWGLNEDNQLGLGDYTNRNIPCLIKGLRFQSLY